MFFYLVQVQNLKDMKFISGTDRHLEYIDRKLEEYNSALQSADGDTRTQIQTQIEIQHQRKEKYLDLKEQLEQSD